jgi:protein-glutamine gamma-glutamyltransferase
MSHDVACKLLPARVGCSEQRKPAGGDAVPLQLQLSVLAMAMIAVATFAVSKANGRTFEPAALLWLTAQLGVMSIVAWRMRRLSHVWREPPAIAPILVALGILAIGWEFLSRRWLGEGQPFEVLTMSALRNIVLGLGAASVWRRYQPICVVMCLFLTLFGATTSRDVAAQALATLFALAAIGWLLTWHWDGLQHRVAGKRSRLPLRVATLPILLLMVTAFTLAASDRRVTTALSGCLPSSGGDGSADPYARGGIGDGDMVVAGTNRIQSFAPIEDAPFMQDDQPSLYDVFDDSYGEPIPPKSQDRTIALPPELASRVKEHLHSRVEKASREFSTLRHSPDESVRREAGDVRSDALFYVAGRVPLHLRLQVYDVFDGVNWYPEEQNEAPEPLQMVTTQGKPWVTRTDRRELWSFLGPAETHAIKVVNLDTDIVPAPLYLHGIHIDLVDRLDMYDHGPDGLIRLNRSALPRLVPIHIASRSVDHSVLAETRHAFMHSGKGSQIVVPGTLDQGQITALAKSWSHGTEAGWSQIQAIVQRLRTSYIHDRQARPLQDTEDPTSHFLFESKRGPDFQFATSAALLLRSLGYPTRVVSGFYANDAKYDSHSRHTPVHVGDVHFWAEVRVGLSDWVTLEPTPGYTVLGPPPDLLDRAWSLVCASAAWLIARWPIVVMLSVISLSLYCFRRELVDRIDEVWWRLSPNPSQAALVLATVALLSRRARRAGRPRPASVTSAGWLQGLACQFPEWADRLSRLADDADLVVFGPPTLIESAELSLGFAGCRRLVADLSLKRLRTSNKVDAASRRADSFTPENPELAGAF